MLALREAGYQVHAAASEDGYHANIKEAGFTFHPIQIQGKGANPLADVRLMKQYQRIFREIQPQVILNFTIKPVIYSTLAAKKMNIPVINNIAGLGTLFHQTSWVTKVAIVLYRLSQQKVQHIFFQNEDDVELFKRLQILKEQSYSRLPGSGVDVGRFKPKVESQKSKVESYQSTELCESQANDQKRRVNFLLFGRMLWDKGVREYVEAAREIKKYYPQANFWILGLLDFENPTAIKSKDMQLWIEEGVIDYLGKTNRVEEVIAQADCIVYPSYYREGVPRSLLEAAAMGKPIITTHNVGCKEVVDEGENGFKVEKRSVPQLKEAIEKFILLPLEKKIELGEKSRRLVETRFDEKFVIQAYFTEIEKALK